MTTTRTRDHRPEPTVRPPSSRAAARFGKAAVLPFIAGVFAAAMCVALHRWVLAAAAFGLGAAVSAPFLVVAGVVQARQMRFNPWPVSLLAGLLPAFVIWRILPVIGLGWARIPMAAGTVWLAWRGIRAGIRHHRRADAYRRLAQTLSAVVSQSAGQQEQVLAGLAGTARAERVTAPHFGAAPNAAWTLRITRWDGAAFACFVLKLPAHDDITSPDFLAKIKDAVRRKLGVSVRLHVDSLRDEITGDVSDGREEQPDPATLRDRARDRVKVVAGMLLKGVQVTDLVINEEAEIPDGDGIAGVGQAIREVTIIYDPTAKVTMPNSRNQITDHMSTQLTGAPGLLRADWQVDQETVRFRRRRQFPALIPAPVLTAPLLLEAFGDRVVLACAEDEDGDLVGYALSKTTLPHGGVIGPTGGGKTQLLLLLAMRAAQLGVEVWGADPKQIELMGLRGWPNVPKIATRIEDIVKLIGDAHTEMYKRINDVAAGKVRRSDLKRLLVIIDEYFVFRMLLNTWWAAQPKDSKGPKEHIAVGQIAEMLALCRGLNMNIVIGVQRPDAVLFDTGARDNIGWWASMGSLSQQGALMTWGDAHTGTDLPPDEPGLSTMTTPKGPGRAKVHYVPNPADALVGDGLSQEDMAFLRSMLPPGTTWNGPLPLDDPDPGFEDSSAAGHAIAADPVTGFLFLLQIALSSRTAHLTGVPGGGAPASGEGAGRYGWGTGPGGQPEAGGTWIGAVEETKDGRRAYLRPQQAYDAARRYAEELGEDFDLTRTQLDEALRKSGLLKTEATKEGTRYTVRRPLPVAGGDGDDRQRVWDIPEEALLHVSTAPARRPGTPPPASAAAAPAPPARHPAPAAQPAEAPPASTPPRFRRAGALEDSTRIVLRFDDGSELTVTVVGVPAPDPDWAKNPSPDGVPWLLLDYVDDQGTPGWVRARANHPIRLEQPGNNQGRQ